MRPCTGQRTFTQAPEPEAADGHQPFREIHVFQGGAGQQQRGAWPVLATSAGLAAPDRDQECLLATPITHPPNPVTSCHKQLGMPGVPEPICTFAWH